MAQIDFDGYIKGKEQLKRVKDEILQSYHKINTKYEENEKQIAEVLDKNQRNHAQALAELNKVIESFMPKE